MKVLLITKDKTLFVPGSKSLVKLGKVAQSVEQIHVVVFTDESEGHKTQILHDRIFLYSTNSGSSLLSIREAVNTAELQTLINSHLVVDLIIADDPYYCAAVAYYLSNKYKKKFLVNVFENMSSDLLDGGAFNVWIKKKIANYVLPRAHGIHVLNQLVAEAICADTPKLEDRIYILPEPLESDEGASSESGIELKTRYPNFHLYIVSVVDSKSKKVEDRLRNIIETLRMRYQRAGLIVIDNNALYKHKKSPYIVWETGIKDLNPYYKSAHIFVDVSNDSKPGGALTGAVLQGCPIVAAQSPESTYVVRHGKNGFVVNPDNPPEFCGRIAEIVETPGLRESIKLFKYEMDKLILNRKEEYLPALISVWERVTQTKEVFEPGTVEEYTREFVYALRDTRRQMQKIAEKIDKDISAAGGKLGSSFDMHKPRKVTEQTKIYEDNEILDIDAILKK